MDTDRFSDELTYSTVLIECTLSNGGISTGTGFILNLHDKDNNTIPCVITNEHVVKDSIQTTFGFCKADKDGNPIDTASQTVSYLEQAWIRHPDQDVDLVCFPLNVFFNAFAAKNIKVYYTPLETDLIPDQETINDFMAMEDVVMVGYPIGLSDRYNNKPVIRKGITASHPRNNYQGKKEILLDIASFPGSSGSPVFLLRNGMYNDEQGVYYSFSLYLLGVLYGGPQYNAEGVLQFANLPVAPTPFVPIPTNLGIIIKSERLLEFETVL